MAVALILNERSWTPRAINLHGATVRMRSLMQLIREGTRLGAERALHVTSTFFTEELAGDITVLKWKDQAGLDEVERDFFLDMVTAVVYFDEGSLGGEMTAEYAGAQALGLGFSYRSDGLALSFNSSPDWDTSEVSVDIWTLDAENGDIVTDTASIRHASCPQHITSHSGWIQSRADVPPFSELGARLVIDSIVAALRLQETPLAYEFGSDFISSAKQNGFFEDGRMRHILAESCARILLGREKNSLNTWNTAPLAAGWSAFRTHLTKSGPGYRLMLWHTPDGRIVFANVGTKFEEWISYALSH